MSSALNVCLLPLPGQCLSSSDLMPPPSRSLPGLPQTMSPSVISPVVLVLISYHHTRWDHVVPITPPRLHEPQEGSSRAHCGHC